MSKRDPKEWEFGQKVIEQDYATLDHVRECLAIQDKIWAMGETPKPLAEIMIEKGYLQEHQAAMVRQILLKGRIEQAIDSEIMMPTEVDNPVKTNPFKPAPEPALQSPPPRPAGSAPVSSSPRSSPGSSRSVTRRTGMPPSRFPVASLAVVAVVLLLGLAAAYWILFVKDPKGARTSGPVGPGSGTDAYGSLPKSELKRIAAMAALSGKNFNDYWDVVDQWTRFKDKYKGTPWFEKANEEEKQYRLKAEEFASRLLQSLRDKEKPFRSRGQFLEVIRIYRDFPTALHDATAAGGHVKEELKVLSARFDEQLHLDRAALERLIAEKRFDDALAKIASMELYADDGERTKLVSKKADVQKLKDRQSLTLFSEMTSEYTRVASGFSKLKQDRKSDEVLQAIHGFLRDRRFTSALVRILPSEIHTVSFWEALEHRDHAGAWGMCRPVMLKLKSQELAPGSLDLQTRLLFDLSDALLLELLMEDVRKGATMISASRETVRMNTFGGQDGSISAESGRFLFQPGQGEKKELQWRGPVMAEDLELLAIRSLDPDRVKAAARILTDAAMQSRLGLMYYYSSRPEHLPRAYGYLKKAWSMGESWLVLYVQPLERLVESRKDSILREKFERAQEAAKKKQYAEARKLLEEIKNEAAGTAFAREKMGTVDGLMKNVEEAMSEESGSKEKIRALEKEHRCRVEWVAKDTYRFRYDFVSDEQLGAFNLLNREKGQWLVVGGELRGVRSPGLMWKKKLAGDVTVEFKLTMVEDQNMLVNLYYRPGTDKYYNLALGLRVADREADLKMGIPRLAVLKDPKSFTPEELKKPEAWDRFKKQIISRETRPMTLERNKTYAVRIERSGEDLRLRVDGALVCEARDKEYTEGHLVLSLAQSNVRIDDLSITAKVEQ